MAALLTSIRLVLCCAGILLAFQAQLGQCQESEYMPWRGPCAFRGSTMLCNHSRTIVLGGLFPLHQTHANTSANQPPTASNLCGDAIQMVGFERMEAMRFAIEEINRDAAILPTITLAFEMRDTCATEIYTNQQTVRFVQREDPAKCTSSLLPISGVVGAASSGASIAAANLLRIFEVPQISYASTSATLSESRYNYFLRTVPPDVFQARAVVAIAHALQMRYLGLLSTVGAYGRDGAAEVQRELETRSVACVAASADLGDNKVLPMDSATYTDALDALSNNVSINASAAVAFSGKDGMFGFSKAINNRQYRLPEKFTWFATDAWARNADFLHADVIDVSRGTIGVTPSTSVVERFTNYFLSLHPVNNTGPARNPWLSEFWISTFSCDPDPCLDGNASRPSYCDECLRNSLRNTNYTQNSKIAFVINAVNAFARALHTMHRDRCGGGSDPGICKAMLSSGKSRNGAVDGPTLLAYLRNVTFEGEGGQLVAFDQAGDMESAVYGIHNIQVASGNTMGDHVAVGTWEQLPHNHSAQTLSPTAPVDGTIVVVACSDPTLNSSDCPRSKLVLHADKIQWRDGSMGWEERPQSRCSAPCRPGQQAVKIESFPKEVFPSCCWECRRCKPNMYTPNQNTNCRPCSPTQKVTTNQTACVGLKKDVFSVGDKSAIACLSIASMLIIPVLIAFPIIFAVVDLLPMHSALQCRSMVIATVGALATLLLVFIFLIPPSGFSCTFRAVWSIFGLVSLIAPFLVETLDILQAFRSQNRPETPEKTDSNAATESSSTEATTETPSKGLGRRSRTLTAIALDQSFRPWAFIVIYSIAVVVAVMAIVLDHPTVENDVMPNREWHVTCKLSAVNSAGLALVCLLIIATMTARFYCLYLNIYVPFTIQLSNFMLMASALLIASMLVGYTQLENAIVREAMLLLIHLAVALAMYSVVVQDLLRTLIPERSGAGKNKQLYGKNQGDGIPGVGEQIQMTLAERSLFNRENRRKRSHLSAPSQEQESKVSSAGATGYETGGSSGTLGHSSAGSIERNNPSSSEKYIVGGSGLSEESGYGGATKTSGISHPEMELSPLSVSQDSAMPSKEHPARSRPRSQHSLNHAVVELDNDAPNGRDLHRTPDNESLHVPGEQNVHSTSSDNLVTEEGPVSHV